MKQLYHPYVCFLCVTPIAEQPVFAGRFNLHQGCYQKLGGNLETVGKEIERIYSERQKQLTPLYENKGVL